MNVPLALQFEATNFLDPTALVLLITAVIMLASFVVGVFLDKYGRINFSSLNMLSTMFVAFTVTMLPGCVLISALSESPSEKRVNNIEKGYEGVEVIDLTYSSDNKERVATLLVDGQTVTATLREDPDTFEPTLYPYASEDAVNLEKVSSE